MNFEELDSRSNMHILVIGGAGYVGGYLVDRLLALDYSVTVYDNLCYEKLYLKDVNFVYGDVRDFKKLKTILDNGNFYAVINLAALVGDGACSIDKNLSKLINVDCTNFIVDNFEGKIIFPSTCSVYGINHDLIDENAIPNPQSVYAETKLEAEQYLLKNRDNATVFRLGTLFGLSDQFSRVRLDLVANILAAKAALGQKLSVFGGEQWRPLLHVKDVARAMCFSLESSKFNGLYNLSYKNYTIAQVAQEIQSLVPETVVEYTDINFEDMRNYKVLNTKLAETGFSPAYTMKDGLQEIINATKQHRIVDINDPVFSNVAYLKKILQ